MLIHIQSLVDAQNNRLVKSVKHHEFPITIWNYTDNCVFKSKNWNFFTRNARGLVTTDSGLVVAKSYEKFFNLNETYETMIFNLPDLPFDCFAKVDDSLILVYKFDNHLMVHTRGSFDNEQSSVARNFIAKNISCQQLDYYLDQNITLSFEVVYRGNGIFTYGDGKPNLILIGAFHNDTWEDYTYDALQVIARDIHCDVVEKYDYNIDRAIEFNEPMNEGFVIRFSNNLRVKIKTKWYLSAFRAKNFWNPNKAIELLKNNVDIDSIQFESQEEQQIVFDTVEFCRCAFNNISANALHVFEEVKNKSRKDTAIFLKTNHQNIAPIVFKMLDKKCYDKEVWSLVEQSLSTEQKEER